MERKTHTIDAKNKILGRLAVEAAMLLRGKQRPDFSPNKDAGDFVVIKNGKEIKLSGKKKKEKVYYRHSGYLGGLKKTVFDRAFDRDYKRVIRESVYGMLPKNKLRSKQIKRLKIE